MYMKSYQLVPRIAMTTDSLVVVSYAWKQDLTCSQRLPLAWGLTQPNAFLEKQHQVERRRLGFLSGSVRQASTTGADWFWNMYNIVWYFLGITINTMKIPKISKHNKATDGLIQEVLRIVMLFEVAADVAEWCNHLAKIFILFKLFLIHFLIRISLPWGSKHIEVWHILGIKNMLHYDKTRD